MSGREFLAISGLAWQTFSSGSAIRGRAREELYETKLCGN